MNHRYVPAAVLALVCLAALLIVTAWVPPATAQVAAPTQPGVMESYSFRGPVQERRFHGLISNMRCLENPDQSLAESTAPQAREMRAAVFRMLQDDRADFEIRLVMVDLYGEDVLYQSAFAGHRLLLTWGPFILLVVGLIAAFIVSMRKRRAAQ